MIINSFPMGTGGEGRGVEGRGGGVSLTLYWNFKAIHDIL